MQRAVCVFLLAFSFSTQPLYAQAVDTDGDGLLDLIDAPGFDPNATGNADFSDRSIEDLDGANRLVNVQSLNLLRNQITNIESGDFDGLTLLSR